MFLECEMTTTNDPHIINAYRQASHLQREGLLVMIADKDRELATLRADNARLKQSLAETQEENASLRAQVEAITSPLPGKPTEPGHYWHGDKYDEYCWHVVRVRMYGNDLAVGNSQISGWSDSDIWAGPIPEPVALEAAEKSDAGADNPRDWTEDFGRENGNYSNKCTVCGDYFNGHKRRFICKTCTKLLRDCLKGW